MGRVIRFCVVDIRRFDSDADVSRNESICAADDGNDAPRCDGQFDGTHHLRAGSRHQLSTIRPEQRRNTRYRSLKASAEI